VLLLGDHILVCHAVAKMPDDAWLGVGRDGLVIDMKRPVSPQGGPHGTGCVVEGRGGCT